MMAFAASTIWSGREFQTASSLDETCFLHLPSIFFTLNLLPWFLNPFWSFLFIQALPSQFYNLNSVSTNLLLSKGIVSALSTFPFRYASNSSNNPVNLYSLLNTTVSSDSVITQTVHHTQAAVYMVFAVIT